MSKQKPAPETPPVPEGSPPLTQQGPSLSDLLGVACRIIGEQTVIDRWKDEQRVEAEESLASLPIPDEQASEGAELDPSDVPAQ